MQLAIGSDLTAFGAASSSVLKGRELTPAAPEGFLYLLFCRKYEGCGGIPTPCNGVSEFGASDSPPACNTSTMYEWGVNLHYVKVGL